jgi:hypothetical protein
MPLAHRSHYDIFVCINNIDDARNSKTWIAIELARRNDVHPSILLSEAGTFERVCIIIIRLLKMSEIHATEINAIRELRICAAMTCCIYVYTCAITRSTTATASEDGQYACRVRAAEFAVVEVDEAAVVLPVTVAEVEMFDVVVAVALDGDKLPE